jgi:hypothetical protein
MIFPETVIHDYGGKYRAHVDGKDCGFTFHGPVRATREESLKDAQLVIDGVTRKRDKDAKSTSDIADQVTGPRCDQCLYYAYDMMAHEMLCRWLPHYEGRLPDDWCGQFKRK